MGETITITVEERRRGDGTAYKLDYAGSNGPILRKGTTEKNNPGTLPLSPSLDPTPSPTSGRPSPTTDEFVSKFKVPTYTMKQIHASIPAHCLIPSTSLSILYFLRDILMVVSLLGISLFIHPYIPSSLGYQIPFFLAYSFMQGLLFTGLWELAHECGHGALFEKKWMNHAMGLFIHSCLLVPYHSWRFTHSTHHKTTNNLERDIAFVPMTREAYDLSNPPPPTSPKQVDGAEPHEFITWPDWHQIHSYMEDTPIFVLTHLFFHQLIAWPLYLSINNFALPRMAAVPWWKRSHFYFFGDGPNFTARQCKEVFISDLGIAAMAGVLWGIGRMAGGGNVGLWYGLPWLWTNHWICISSPFPS